MRTQRTRWALILSCFLFGVTFLGAEHGSLVLGQATGQQSEEVSKGREAFGQACVTCHSMNHTVIKRKTEEQWRDTVFSMISRGAQVMPDEIEPITAYLTDSFGPDSPLPSVQGSQSSTPLPNASGRNLIVSSCTQCHTLELVTGSRKSEQEWKETISRMLGYGAALTSDEQGVLTEYLVEHLGQD